MAWNDTGEDRMRRFKYVQEQEAEKRELQRKYNAATERISLLLDEVERQKTKIAELARELHHSAPPKAETRPPPAKSQTQLQVRDILDQLAKIIEEKTG